MSSLKKLSDPNTDPEEVDAIIGSFVRRHENERLRQRWEKLLRQQDGESVPREVTPPTRVRRLLPWLLAAAAALLIAVLIVPGLWNSPVAGSTLLAENREAITLITYRSGANVVNREDSLRASLATHFAAGDFDRAVTDAEALLAGGGASVQDSMNLGLVYNKIKANTDAIRILSPLANKSAGIYRTEARYWLAIAYLDAGETERGRALLTEIKPEDGRSVFRNARALLEASWTE